MHKNEQTVRALLDAVHSGDVSGLDKDRYFQPDAYYQPLVPAVPPIRTSVAIVAEIQRQLGLYRDLHAEIHVIMADDRHVFTERTDHVTFRDSGRRVSVPLMAVFDFAADGRISAWREIFDTKAAERQIGVSAEAMDAIMGQTT
jgi:limonene-1,2-epoxide hydrolase